MENSSQKDSKKVNCKICHNPFPSEPLLIKHFKAVHLKDRPFQCKNCEACFKAEKDLKKHNATVHGEKKEGIKCSLCSANFSNKFNLNRHMAAAHKEKTQNDTRYAIGVMILFLANF